MFFYYYNYENKFMTEFYAPESRESGSEVIRKIITKDSGKSVVCDRVILEFYVEYFC